MKPSGLPVIIAVALALVPLAPRATAADLGKLKVLYIGDRDATRATQFEDFLGKNMGQVAITSRDTFKPAEADDADVVLLDWPQSGSAREERQARAPLGDRVNWSKPTVLLGSAGLNLAVVWKVRGGSG